MSDYLFCSRRQVTGVLRKIIARHLGPVTESVVEYHGGWGSLAVARAPHDPVGVVEDDRVLSVLVGEPLARLPGGPAGNATEPERRLALHRLLAAGGRPSWDDHLDGPFTALVVDKVSGNGLVLTDLFAWIPAFAAQAPGAATGLVLGTHVDAVADAAGVREALDPVSAAELLSYFTVTFPHTLFAGVEQVPPGVERAFEVPGWSGPGRTYWQPVEQTSYASRSDAAAELRSALIDDVRAACAGQDAVGLLLSGGEDSRAVAGAVPAEVAIRAFTYAPFYNREIRSARRVARAYGAAFVVGIRDAVHDLRHFETVSGMVGAHNMFLDAHGFGLHESLGMRDLPLVLGGFSSDALLKGDNILASGQAALRRGRRPLTRTWKRVPLAGVREELLLAAVERRERFRLQLEELRPESADEWCRIYPFTMRKYAANFHGNRRLFRTHEPYMSNRVVRLAASVPQRWKVDRALFREAMRPLLARSWYVPHSRNRLPFFGRRVNQAARPVLGAIRTARAAVTGTLGANQESWPIWSELVASAEMEEMRRRYPAVRSRVGRELVSLRGDLDRSSSEWPPLHRLMLLQLCYATAEPGER